MADVNDHTKRKNNLILILLVAIGVILFIAFFSIDSSSNNKKRIEPEKTFANKFVSENDMTKTRWLGEVSDDNLTINKKLNAQKKETLSLKDEVKKLKNIIRNNVNKQSNTNNKTENIEVKKDTKIKIENGRFVAKEVLNNNSSNLYKNFPSPFGNVGFKNNDKVQSVPKSNNEQTVNTPLFNTLIITNPIQDEEEEEKKREKRKDIISSGSILQVMLLNGFDAPTMAQAKTNPIPILMKVTNLAKLPNRKKYDLKDCNVIGEGYGDLSSERVYIRTNTLACVTETNKHIDMPIKGMIAGEDGKIGLRGTVVTKQGAALARTVMAGFVANVGDAFSKQGQSSTNSVIGTTTTNSLSGGQAMKNGAYAGLGKGAAKLEEFYLKLADQTAPVIEIAAKRRVDLITTSMTELRLVENMEESENENN